MKNVLLAALLASSASASSPRVIGVALPLSGPRQSRGESILESLRIKVDELNAAGGVAGGRIELRVIDEENTAEGAKKAATTLAADPSVLAVIGHYDSEPAAAAAGIYTKAEVPAFFPAIGDGDVFRKSPWVFGGTYDDATEVQTLAAFIKVVRHHNDVLVLHNDADYGRNLWKAFSHKAAHVGLKVRDVEFPATFKKSGALVPSDFIKRALPRGVGSAKAVVIFGNSENAAELIKQLRAKKINLPVYGGSRLASGGIVGLLGEDTEDIHSAFPFMYDFGTLKTQKFLEAYAQRRPGDPNTFGLFAYDGLGLIAEAIEKKGANRRAIRDYLAAANSEKSAYDGAGGLLWFDARGAAVRDPIMGTIVKGRFQPCFTQLRVVTESHTLANLADKVKEGEVIVVDDTPFFKIDVVYAGVEFYRVNQVNIKDLNYEAELFLWLKWSGDVDVENVQFLNEIPGKGYRIEMRKLKMRADWHGGDDVNWISYRYKGTFLHPYDLRRFPFDRQALPLLLSHKTKNANKIQLVADSAEMVDRAITDIYPQEWRYEGRRDYATTFRYASAFGNPTYARGQAQAPYSVYRSEMKIHRILFPYLVTLFLPLAMLMAVSLLVLIIPKEQFAPRNGLVMSSLLGVLVYHMAQARALPQVGYLMKADLYFVVAYMLLASLVLGLNVVNLLIANKKEKKAEKLDYWMKRAFVVLTVVAYAGLTISAMRFGK